MPITVVCDACGYDMRTSIRYQCAICENFDFCAECKVLDGDRSPTDSKKHDVTHPFTLIKPGQLDPKSKGPPPKVRRVLEGTDSGPRAK
jgi:hypothetical protein